MSISDHPYTQKVLLSKPTFICLQIFLFLLRWYEQVYRAYLKKCVDFGIFHRSIFLSQCGFLECFPPHLFCVPWDVTHRFVTKILRQGKPARAVRISSAVAMISAEFSITVLLEFVRMDWHVLYTTETVAGNRESVWVSGRLYRGMSKISVSYQYRISCPLTLVSIQFKVLSDNTAEGSVSFNSFIRGFGTLVNHSKKVSVLRQIFE